MEHKGKRPITVILTRTQSRVLLQAAGKLLRDKVACPRGPERNALVSACDAISAAREGESRRA